MKKRNLFLITMFTIITTACLLALTGCSSRTIDLEKLAEIEFSGLNGKGTAKVMLNEEMYSDTEFLESLYPDESRGEAMFKFLDLMDNVNYTFSTETELSNGDEITVKVDYDEETFNNEKINLQNSEFKITVNGLLNGTTVDVFEGFEVSYSGFSGKGYAFFDMENCNDFAKNYVYFKCDENNLSNGDTITVTAVYDTETAEDELIIVESDTKEYKVSGLAEPVEIDPFEKLEITYTGASPYIQAVIDSTKCDSMVNKYIQFDIENNYLRNGDIFTVTATYNEYDAETYGFIVKNDTKTYTVENQPEYITSLDDLDLTGLQAELNDKLTVTTTANEGDGSFAGVYLWNSFKAIAEKKHRTSYLVSLKNSFEDKFDGYNYNYNRYIQIYEYTINAKKEQKKVYVAVYVNNICKNADGTISWDIQLGALGDENYDTLVNKFATSEKEFYNVSEIKAE